MNFLFSFVIALFLTMVLMPPLMRLAGPLRLVDLPGPRKVHPGVIPRCGGVAVIVGALTPVFMLVPLSTELLSFLIGGAIIVIFGVWDDSRELSFRWKLTGQILGTLVLIQGGFVLDHLPLCGLDAVHPIISYPVTALFILGITNAINLSDGLDGLAAGCSLITLTMIAFLAYPVQGYSVVIVALAIMGGIVGFLRFNTYPALVFLGDAGSQFLGFSAAAFTIYLLEDVHPALSPALPVLLFGLPILDTAWVMAQRILRGRSPFRADRNHIHHKLLALGFRHHEAVGFIYLLHGILVFGAYFLTYESDILIIAVFLLFCALLLGQYYLAKRRHWRLHPPPADEGFIERRNPWLRRLDWLPLVSVRALAYGIGLFLIVGALTAREIAGDFAIVGFALIALLAFAAVFLRPYTKIFARCGLYVASALVAYLLIPLPAGAWLTDLGINLYFVALAVAMLIAIRVTRRDFFRITPQDLLILFFAIVIPNLSGEFVGDFPIGETVFRLAVLFYAAEFLLNSGQDYFREVHSYRALRITTVLALAIIGLRGAFF